MSGDVQPRKRKDKRRKRDAFDRKSEGDISRQSSFQDDDESSHGVHITKMGSDDVHLHVHHEHETGGHWCAKVLFFILLTVLLGIISLIILENRGLSDLDTPLSESRFSNYFDGWVEEHRIEHDHEPEDAVDASIQEHEEHDEPFEEEEDDENEEADDDDEDETEHDEDEEEEDNVTEETSKQIEEDDDEEDKDKNDAENLTEEVTQEETAEEDNDEDDDDENDEDATNDENDNDDDNNDDEADNDNDDADLKKENINNESKEKPGQRDYKKSVKGEEEEIYKRASQYTDPEANDDDNDDDNNDDFNDDDDDDDDNDDDNDDDDVDDNDNDDDGNDDGNDDTNDDTNDDPFDEEDDNGTFESLEKVVDNDAEELALLKEKARQQAAESAKDEPQSAEENENDGAAAPTWASSRK